MQKKKLHKKSSSLVWSFLSPSLLVFSLFFYGNIFIDPSYALNLLIAYVEILFLHSGPMPTLLPLQGCEEYWYESKKTLSLHFKTKM